MVDSLRKTLTIMVGSKEGDIEEVIKSNSSANQTEANKDIHKIVYVEIKGDKVGIAD